MSMDDESDHDLLLCSEVMRPSSSSPVYDQQICCLLDAGTRCEKIAGNASYNKRVQKIVAQKNLRLSLDENAHHLYICDQHKSIIQSVRAKRKRRESASESSSRSFQSTSSHLPNLTSAAVPLSPPTPSSLTLPISTTTPVSLGRGRLTPSPLSLSPPSLPSAPPLPPPPEASVDKGPDIDWGALPMTTLRRYKKVFKVQVNSSGSSAVAKAALVEAIDKDFKSLPVVSEKEILTYFVYMIKTGASKLDSETHFPLPGSSAGSAASGSKSKSD